MVEEPEELHAEAEDIELPAEDKSANKKVRIPIWEIRLLALLGTLTFVGLTVLISLMAFVVLGRISPTLMTFASFAYLGGILAIYDLVQTLRGTKVDARLSWDWQHFSFRRFMVLFTVQFTMFPPTMLTFILHSKDLQFGSFLTRRATRETFTAHLVAFIWVAVGGLANFGYMRYRLKRARWFKRDRCLGRWSAKVLSLFIIVGVVFSLYSTIMGFLQEFNSGTAFFGILYLVMSLLIIHNCAVLLVRNRLNEKWYLRYRVWNGGHLFAAWSSFWVTLTIISLAASNVSGFWVGVNSLPGFHRSIIYSYMFAMFFFTLVTLCRGFLAKLDKRGRMPRILKARVVDPKTVEQWATTSQLPLVDMAGAASDGKCAAGKGGKRQSDVQRIMATLYDDDDKQEANEGSEQEISKGTGLDENHDDTSKTDRHILVEGGEPSEKEEQGGKGARTYEQW